ncbi:phenylalanine--tRNA ligase, beta subunit [Fusobacterium equinum]|uniref:Phenylalanine--tRNA ligase beta subunit n=1 Tax=Fusobacterium equinum TaxID=134605 RepID=A0A133NLK7_9FUSO|nr:phenylalanine--tRNA ligase subunit beta [Fusobacterium equinum]KXA17169.1 phenylalanine--tRNA ligase, beta subunit [Fusobacterium equinum]
MLISLNWLKQYVDLKEDVLELEKALTMIGQEVENIEEQGKHLHHVVIGKIVDYQKHPNSDKLTLLQVDTGEETLQIVCGAPNHKLGDKVVVAKIGAILPGDFKIKKSEIRKVESYGMLCSEVELGIGTSADGIIILPEDAPIGEEYRKYAKLDDVVFELEITPNRPDCLSYIGIAREIGAYFERKIKYPMIVMDEIIDQVSTQAKITIEDKERCHRYMGRLIKNVKVGESPEWLKQRIQSMGLKPINNIVDITNFVMFECNQPMHAFDFDKLAGNEIFVRAAKEGEEIITLDGVERKLNGELVIADGEKPIAIAGVIGGEATQIDENTKNIFLEVAYFTPENIRKTSRTLGIFTDSAYRNERGMDPEGIPYAMDRAASLIQQVAGGEILSKPLDKYLVRRELTEIPINLEKVNKFVGKALDLDTVGNILTNLEILIKPYGPNALLVTPPSHRADLTRPADIYEEIIRMYGFDNIEAKMPKEDISAGKTAERYEIQENLKKLLTEMGLHEVINYSFIPQKARNIFHYSQPVLEIQNPLSEDMAIMRPNLQYSLLANVRDNFNRNQYDLKFGEVSKTFVKVEGEDLAQEDIHLGIVLAGHKDKTLWNTGKESYDFYDIKAYVETVLAEMGIQNYNLIRSMDSNFHPGRSADIQIGRECIGTFGEVHPDIAEAMEIKKERVYLAELNITTMKKYSKKKLGYDRVSKYPAVLRDLAIVLDQDVLVGEMVKMIQKKHSLIEHIDIFDVYYGENLGEGKKSIAISIIFRDKKKTLSDTEIEENIQSILKLIREKYQGEIRQ